MRLPDYDGNDTMVAAVPRPVAAPVGDAVPKRRGLFARFLDALHHSRKRAAEREIHRHRHLIREARDYAARQNLDDSSLSRLPHTRSPSLWCD